MDWIRIIKNVYLILEDLAEGMWRSILALCSVVSIGWIFQQEGIELGVMIYFMNFLVYWAVFTFMKKTLVRKFQIYKEYFSHNIKDSEKEKK